MNTAEIDRILRHTLEDFRLSRGERRVLASTLDQLNPSTHELALLRSRAFEIAAEPLLDAETKAVLDWLEDVVKTLHPKPSNQPPADEVYFSPGDDCPRRIVNLLDSTQQTAEICVFTITDDRITEAILEAHHRKVEVRVITDNDKASDLGSDAYQLQRAGVPLRVDQSENHMHHKYAVLDRRRTLTGSYNWTRSAARYNEENFVVTYDPQTARAFGQHFDKLWASLE